jgi:hypothetical protein
MITPTLTLPHQGGGNWENPKFSPSPRGRGVGEGDKKGNSYTIKLRVTKVS